MNLSSAQAFDPLLVEQGGVETLCYAVQHGFEPGIYAPATINRRRYAHLLPGNLVAGVGVLDEMSAERADARGGVQQLSLEMAESTLM